MNSFKNSEAKENIFFTSCKQNLGVKYLFDRIFNKINQRENLWKKVEYEIESSYKNRSVEEKQKKAQCQPFFCCNSRKAEETNKLTDKKSMGEVSNEHFIQYVDIEDDENDKYRNMINKMNYKNLNNDQNKKDIFQGEGDKNFQKDDNNENNIDPGKKGGCLLF